MKRKLFFISLLSFSFVMSCNEDSLDKVNPNGVTADTYFSNESELISGVNSVYAIAQSNNLASREWFFTHDLRGDEMSSGGGQLETPRNQLLIGVHDPTNQLTNQVWRGFYRLIHRANVVIEATPKVTSVSEATRNRIAGEARFLKAWAYFDLATLYGGVPLYKTYVKSVDGSNPRSSQKEVYDYVISELKAIESFLPTTYPASELGRATKFASQTLLARTYLQLGDYGNAKTELLKIVNSGSLKLVDNYLDLTNEEGEFNSESIFEIVFSPSGGAYNWDDSRDSDGTALQEETCRSQEYSAIGWRNLVPSNTILNAYERKSKGDAKDDPRFNMSFWREGDKINNGASTLTPDRIQGNSSIVDGKTEKISWRKYSLLYKAEGGFLMSPINMRLMRYADVLLMLAECENELGNSAAAITLLNQVRARKSVDMPPFPTKNYPCSNKSEIFDAVVQERRIELAAEQVRDLDIIRWRKNNKQKAEPIAYFIKGKHELLPLPQSEIDNNPKIDQKDQNPGY